MGAAVASKSPDTADGAQRRFADRPRDFDREQALIQALASAPGGPPTAT
jgi:hypothetical protein